MPGGRYFKHSLIAEMADVPSVALTNHPILKRRGTKKKEEILATMSQDHKIQVRGAATMKAEGRVEIIRAKPTKPSV